MAVRESRDRRVGGDPEKLLTLEEAAGLLECPADDVEAMIRTGRLSSFRLGGSLLRVRLQDIEALKFERGKSPGRVASQGARTVEAILRQRRIRFWRRESQVVRNKNNSFQEKLSDFFYFNDFYVLAALIILTLLAVLVAI